MKKFCVCVAAACLFQLAAMGGEYGAAPSGTPKGAYIVAHGGVNWAGGSGSRVEGVGKTNIKTKTGFALGGALGYSFGCLGIGTPRVEIETTWRKNRLRGGLGGANSQMAYMFNILYDFNTHTRLYPYLGAGAGLATSNLKVDGDHARRNSFAYQGIAGVGFNVTEKVGLTLDYRYMHSKLKESGVDKKNRNHGVFAGVRFSF